MKLYRFSPITDHTQLMKAIEYIHFACHAMCKKTFGEYLPVAGNIGVFCHFEDEFERLTELKKELTDVNVHWNEKYFRLHKPIIIPEKNGVPETTYTYLYIRHPDPKHPEVGDLDFYLEPESFSKLKGLLMSGKVMKGIRILDRSDIDLLELYDEGSDVLTFVGKKTMAENIKQ